MSYLHYKKTGQNRPSKTVGYDKKTVGFRSKIDRTRWSVLEIWSGLRTKIDCPVGRLSRSQKLTAPGTTLPSVGFIPTHFSAGRFCPVFFVVLYICENSSILLINMNSVYIYIYIKNHVIFIDEHKHVLHKQIIYNEVLTTQKI